MTDLSKLTQYVIDELRSTEEYKEYEACLTELVKDRDLYYRVNEMREKNFKIQLSRNDDMIELMDALTNEYEDVINLELVRNFLDSEAAVCRLFQEFHNTVTEGLEFN